MILNKNLTFRGLLVLFYILSVSMCTNAQKKQLTIEKIMQDPNWMGTSPSGIFWGEKNDVIYFSWNPDKNLGDSLYKYDLNLKKISKVTANESNLIPTSQGVYDSDFSRKAYIHNGDLYLYFEKTNLKKQITASIEIESDPKFTADDQNLIYSSNNKLIIYSIENGTSRQLVNFEPSSKKVDIARSDQEIELEKDQLELFDVIRQKKLKEDKVKKAKLEIKSVPTIYLNDKRLSNMQLDPSLSYLVFNSTNSPKNSKNTIVPNYFTSSGFTEEIASRTKVGSPQAESETFIYNFKTDSLTKVTFKDLPGFQDLPDFIKEKKDSSSKLFKRKIALNNLTWSPLGSRLVAIASANDNKDRWIVNIDTKTGKCSVIDRQRDEAWIGGPGIGGGSPTLGWLNETEVYFQSEVTGYSHLYSFNLSSNKKTQLTNGDFEIQKVVLSRNKRKFYITSNKENAGEQHFYHLDSNGGELVKITSMVGGNEVTISPDEKTLAVRYSFSNKPWEIFLQQNKVGSEIVKITNSLTSEFNDYPWREPKITTFNATDGQKIFARIYEPKKSNKKAVVFVHGAGYLQNAHKWWSSYFREYMFHNLLADKGYTVIDLDYRASAGYGRDVRTGIYRHMGGKDLSDNVDAANFLIKNYKIDPKKIGIYGGSYGGFITLMAMFTQPDVFKAGAALRPVTDWAAYNHGYTSNILNTPQLDSVAYRRSSPIYFASGLKNKLLICHGVVDVNVHYQDVMRLSQRLIELKKENWEMASYPAEDHGFVEPTSWMDEYKRILKLFEEM